MSTIVTDHKISDEELKSLATAIKTRYGIDFTNYEIKSLKRGFGRLINKHQMTSLIDLWSAILKDKEFFLGCIDDLTVNLTEMFRNPEVWIFLQKLLKKKHSKQAKVKIWHTGCSTGEEVYSMYYIIHSLMLTFKSKVIATDLSPMALNTAKEGKYFGVQANKYARNFGKAFPKGDWSSIFEEIPTGIKIKDRIKRSIEFYTHNLTKDEFPEEVDIIFCRNVMIYFDNDLKSKVLIKFHKALKPNGLLVVGYYDMMPEGFQEFFHVYDNRTKIYIKV
ncbi:protein-glutamate O-methyltransferase CheR [Persicobacter psychrovividus]|uniref:Chemotaxis protein R n=1 Tax=Persicobacter psychrovividus TaxID=387638 RepID=A0ABN6LFJ7_9BACT|nr:chemotaxis protein R [Persicobacter psychrovividus]